MSKLKAKVREVNPPFDFSKGKPVPAADREHFRQAFRNSFGYELPKRGRPPKPEHERTIPTSVRLPRIVKSWAIFEGKRNHMGYQTFLSDFLTKAARKHRA